MVLGLIQTLIAFQGTLSSWWTRIAIGVLLLLFISLQHAAGMLGRRGRRGRAGAE
jgi:ribose/xylose/arabinose/galactoside ABC-type transport system permease subunit